MDSIINLRRQAALDELIGQGWLKHVEWLREVDSTNSLVKRWFTHNAADVPALFAADQQTAGRGRGGNQWWSPSGCLTFTLAIPISELPDDPSLHPQLALVTGVAVARTADSLLGDRQLSRTKLKWPNDAYVDGLKLAGILIEALQTQSQTTGFAIGIGFNTHINWRDAPAAVLEKAVCLSRAAGRVIECETVLLELVQEIREQLANWREHPDEWLTSWRERCLLAGSVVTAKLGESGEVVGRCEGIDSDGRLLLRTEKQLHAVTACEIISWT